MEANDDLRARVKKLNAQATQAKMDLHDLSEELPINWQRIMDVAQRCYDLHRELTEARKALG